MININTTGIHIIALIAQIKKGWLPRRSSEVRSQEAGRITSAANQTKRTMPLRKNSLLAAASGKASKVMRSMATAARGETQAIIATLTAYRNELIDGSNLSGNNDRFNVCQNMTLQIYTLMGKANKSDES